MTKISCPNCGAEIEVEVCPKCEGRGVVLDLTGDIYFLPSTSEMKVCPNCNGKGVIVSGKVVKEVSKV